MTTSQVTNAAPMRVVVWTQSQHRTLGDCWKASITWLWEEAYHSGDHAVVIPSEVACKANPYVDAQGCGEKGGRNESPHDGEDGPALASVAIRRRLKIIVLHTQDSVVLDRSRRSDKT